LNIEGQVTRQRGAILGNADRNINRRLIRIDRQWDDLSLCERSENSGKCEYTFFMVGTKDKLQYWEGKPVLYSDIDEPQRQEESCVSNTPGFLNKAL